MKQTKWTLRLGVAALLCGISWGSVAQGIPGFGKGTDYRLVRKSLIEANWMPVPQPMPPEYDQRVRGIRQMGFSEVDACSPTGMGYCLFVFQHKETRKKLEIITTGEGPGQTLKFSHYAI